MKVTLLNEQYVIHFSHETRKIRVTTATLYKIEETGEVSKVPIITTTAKCSDRDNFQRSVGRKIAFTRLLKWLSNGRFNLSKEDRKVLWDQYFLSSKK